MSLLDDDEFDGVDKQKAHFWFDRFCPSTSRKLQMAVDMASFVLYSPRTTFVRFFPRLFLLTSGRLGAI